MSILYLLLIPVVRQFCNPHITKLQETHQKKITILKSTQNQQNANFLQEPSQIALKAEFFALKCLVIDELSNIQENI